MAVWLTGEKRFAQQGTVINHSTSHDIYPKLCVSYNNITKLSFAGRHARSRQFKGRTSKVLSQEIVKGISGGMKGISHEALKMGRCGDHYRTRCRKQLSKREGPRKVAEGMLGMTLDRRTPTGSNRCVRLSGGQTDIAGVLPNRLSAPCRGIISISRAHAGPDLQ
jgi:hypothetical protein